MNKLFGILFILTGFFAVLGGLYTWGDGSIFKQQELLKVLIPWADIVLTGPLSWLGGFGIIRGKYWGRVLGLVISGIYVFGSVLVIINMIWSADFSVFFIIPALSGLFIGSGFVIWTLVHPQSQNSPGTT